MMRTMPLSRTVPEGSFAVACGIAGLGLLGGIIAFFVGDPLSDHDVRYAPAVLPVVLVGLHLRHRIAALIGPNDRELTRAESSEAWSRVVPDVALGWVAAAVAIAFQVAGSLLERDAFRLVALVDETSTALFITLWALPAIAYARNKGEVVGSLVQAMIWLFVSLLILTISLKFAGIATDVLFGVLGAILPVEIPDQVVDVGRAVASIGAELSFAAWMLGYTWAKSRRWFELWASDEFPSE